MGLSLRPGWVAGLVACAGTSAAAQLAMGPLLPPGAAPFQGLVLQLGYACTGLSLVLALAVHRLGRHAPLRAALTCLPIALLGLALWALAGASAGRYARTFAILPLATFLCLVPARIRPAKPSSEP